VKAPSERRGNQGGRIPCLHETHLVRKVRVVGLRKGGRAEGGVPLHHLQRADDQGGKEKKQAGDELSINGVHLNTIRLAGSKKR